MANDGRGGWPTHLNYASTGCQRHRDDTTETIHRIEKGWKWNVGGPSLRSKGGVLEFGLVVVALEDQNRKSPTLCVPQRMGHPPEISPRSLSPRSPDSVARIASQVMAD